MKQGHSSGSQAGSTKREPIVHKVSETFAGQIGQVLPKPGRAMYEGRGHESPKAAETCHKSGSQGRHG